MRWFFAFCLLALWGPAVAVAGMEILCEAPSPLTIRFNGGRHIPLVYGTERPDVRANGQCRHITHDNVGFVAIWNWAELGDGKHEAVLYHGGLEVTRTTFYVATLGEPFVRSQQARETVVTVPDFPYAGDEAVLVWNQATQHFEVAEFYPADAEPEPEPGPNPNTAALAFLLDRPVWTIEVPDIEDWQDISVDFHATDDGGGYLAPAPAKIEFFRYERGVTPWRDYPAIPPPLVELVGWVQGTSFAGGAVREGLRRLVEVGGTLDVLDTQLALELGVYDARYALVVTGSRLFATAPKAHPTRKDVCYILTFNTLGRTTDGGLATRAFFAMSARSLRSTDTPSQCIAPVLTKGQSTRLTIRER